MSESTDLLELVRKIGLRTSRDAFDAWLVHATKSKASPVQILEQLCALEQREREARNLARRQKMATLGNPKTLDRFDWNHPRSIDRELYEQLHASLDFVRRGDNILLRGQAGVGKTTLAQNLGMRALERGYTVRFCTLPAALADLMKQESIPATERRLRRYTAPDLLVLDELGYVPCDSRAADLLFHIISRRHEARAVRVAGYSGARRRGCTCGTSSATKHQFRFIVSPEDTADLDMKVYVRTLMKQVEQDLGRKLEWAAVNHYDTGHPHAHVVVRGVDREGREVRFDRGYTASGMRWRAQEIATRELGPRRELEIRQAHMREVTQERFTSLDRELERLSVDGRLELRTPKPPTRVNPAILCSRLEQLEATGLAERLASNRWSLSEGWQKMLRELGTRGDILHQMHEAVRGDTSRYRVLGPGEPLLTDRQGNDPLVGRVAGKGLSDETKGTLYAVLETPDGFAYHVPLGAKMAEAVRAQETSSSSVRGGSWPFGPCRPT